MAKYLLTADVHLGRVSSGCGPEHSARAAWLRICREARDGGYAAILVAGDLVDADARYAEAYGALSEGFALDTPPVYAIAGNHDAGSLPGLAALFPDRLRLLGPGRWETAEMPGGWRVCGWSFTESKHPESPFASAPEVDDRTIGLLHGDRGGRAPEAYLPFSAAELTAHRPYVWVLGHYHFSEEPTPGGAFYAGTPQSLKSGETGRHSAWALDGDTGRFSRVCDSTVAYLEVPFDGYAPDDDPLQATVRAVDDALAGVPDAQVVHVRAFATGVSSRSPDEWDRAARTLLNGAGRASRVALDASQVRPYVVLESRAREEGPAGTLARLALFLEGRAEADATTLAALARVESALEAERRMAYRRVLAAPENPEFAGDWRPEATRDALALAAVRRLLASGAFA